MSCSCEAVHGAPWWQGALVKPCMEHRGGRPAPWFTPKAAPERQVTRQLVFVTQEPGMGTLCWCLPAGAIPVRHPVGLAVLPEHGLPPVCWGQVSLGDRVLEEEVTAKAVCATGCQLSPGRLPLLPRTCWVSGVTHSKPPAP